MVPHIAPGTICTTIMLGDTRITIARLRSTSVRFNNAYRKFVLANVTRGWAQSNRFSRFFWLIDPLPDEIHESVINKLMRRSITDSQQYDNV